ncbi:S8 family serine peptidase [Nafulsella turpanensis]|uniref:S8 family serine peptidase n=1 Tax=Nafulsella turpanensis TaxID=1265690 RepID=UPI000348211B|nr:S8 family serine peptidase [Nafulsella turpanensis]
MFRNIFTRQIAVASIAAMVGLASCQTDEPLVNQVDPQSMVETSTSQLIEGQYIIVMKPGAVNGRVDLSGDYATRTAKMKSAILSMFANARISEDAIDRVYSSTVLGFSAKIDAATAARLEKDPNVDYVEQDRLIVLAKPVRGGDGGSVAEEVPFGITRVNGGVTYTGSNVAWVIDTGIDLDHEDLNVDASRGFNAFTTGRDAGSPDDGNGHGTHVAGTIAAIDNEVGVVGVAAGATVVPVKVLDSRGSGSYSGVIAGVDWVGANGKAGDVANMSLGGPVSQALDDAVVAASSNGVVFSLAAGNDSDDSNNHSPARANGANIVTISAMDINDEFAYFSNWANPPVDYCAPGVDIKSTWKDGGYNTISGTSMAAPHAAGVLLLGNASTDGTVIGDPDGNADPIIVH